MRTSFKKKAALALSMALFSFSGFGASAAVFDDPADPPEDIVEVFAADVKASQVNAHFGDDASTQINISFTTTESTPSVVRYRTAAGGALMEARGLSAIGASNKYFHGVALTGLKPDTEYIYTVGTGTGEYTGTFKTAPAQGSKKSFTFAYIADTQVSNADNAKALGANLEVIANSGFDFVYLAGDHTDTAADEKQWELLFDNAGAFPTGGQDMFGALTVAMIQGNHDNNTFARHVNAPAQEGSIVYSFEYGPATFIMLNLESAGSDATARTRQEAFLRAAVKEAKEKGQWVFVGFHKSLYTGASHVNDSDVIAARKFWCPIFAEVDVDFVLQGHDHVYSRGFVASDGNKAISAPAGSAVSDPANAPLYMVGGHAGGLKWYSRISYTPTAGDPLLPGYSFLDVDSASDGSDVKQEQWIVSLEVSEEEVRIVTSAFKYDTAADKVTTESYVYDTLTVKKSHEVARDVKVSVSGPEKFIKETSDDGTLTYVLDAEGVTGANVFAFQVEYDPDKLVFKGVNNLLASPLYSSADDKSGKITVYAGTSSPLKADSTDVASLIFEAKADFKAVRTTVTLKGAQAAFPTGDDADEAEAAVVKGTATTILHSLRAACDINGDSKVTLADLSVAFSDYHTDRLRSDVNLDGVVDAADFIIIASWIGK